MIRYISTVILLFMGCSSPSYRIFDAERHLGTIGKEHWIFHRLVDDKFSFGLQFPGYIIAVEKSKRDIIGIDKAPDGSRIHIQNSVENDLNSYYEKLLDDGERTFVSHIVEYALLDKTSIPRIHPNFIYNAYTDLNYFDYAYEKGWEAVDKLKAELIEKSKTGKYTHIILLSMGWNTNQQESISNFNSIVGHLIDQNGENISKFKPLVIGITWPSEWINFRLLSYFNKANDADEVGMIWMNLLLQNVLIPLKKKTGVRLILIGHSFGARLITRGIFSKNLISNSRPSPEEIDLVIGLQGAFSILRFIDRENSKIHCNDKVPTGTEGAPYAKYAFFAKKYIFTWSEEDTIAPLAQWITGARHIGGFPGSKVAISCPGIFTQATSDANGKLTLSRDDSTWEGSILYVDTSKLIKDQLYNAGGRAHSDIYKQEVGHLIFELIQKYAP